MSLWYANVLDKEIFGETPSKSVQKCGHDQCRPRRACLDLRSRGGEKTGCGDTGTLGGCMDTEEAVLIRVMIVDASELLRSGLKLSLESENDMQVVGEFGSACDAVTAAEELNPDVVLMSIALPDMTGFEACMRILDLVPRTRVVMLTSQIMNDELQATVMVGGAGYVAKDGPQSDVVRTARANGHGEMLHTAPVAELVLRATQFNRRYVNLSLLTQREKQVVVLVGHGLNNPDIAGRLSLSPHTVRSHLTRIFNKLNVSSRAELGIFARAIGAVDVDSAVR